MSKHTKLSELLDKDRERFISVLEASPIPEKAAAFLESETDRLLISYNESNITDRERNSAAGMLQAVRMAMPMVDTIGETRIWEAADADKGLTQRRESKPYILLAVGILAFAAIALTIFVSGEGVNNSFSMWLKLAAAAIEGICLFLAGLGIRRKGSADAAGRRQKTENHVDPSRIFHLYRSVMMVVDKNIEENLAADKWEQPAAYSGGSLLTDAEAELYSELLEALYSKDGAFALDKLRGLRHYLHTRGVELLDYREDTADDFDIMPSKKTGTLRPALVSGGIVLRRGLAAEEVL